MGHGKLSGTRLTARPRDVVVRPRSARFAKHLSSYLLDAFFVSVSYCAVLVLRFDGAVEDDYWVKFLVFLPVALAVHLGANVAGGLYRHVWRHASIREAKQVLIAGGAAGLALVPVYFLVEPTKVPLSVFVLGALLATALMGISRFRLRLLAVSAAPPSNASGTGMRILVVGAGEAGAAIVREMQRSPAEGMVPVAIVDDDPRKQGLALLGVPIVGEVSELPEVCERHGVHRVLFAIPSAGPELVRRVAAAAEKCGLPMQVLPDFGERLFGRVSIRDVRDLNIEDLLGRQQVKTDYVEVSGLIEGRRVMITGGGGSIGSELARQVCEFVPESLVLLDNDETHLHDTIALLDGRVEARLCDIRSWATVIREFERHRPEIVFHAAALKHVPVLESFPCEAVATNILGTELVARAAEAVGTELMVFISTDKAVRPSSVMGASKWVAEQIVLGDNDGSGRRCAVRFGNVLGSRGSVIPTFERQITAGGPVTVTHPDMTRYFMSIEEAVALVLQAAAFADGGELFMLEMGEPVRIYDLAERMIKLSGYAVGSDIEVEITGLRPGEKLAEELHTPEERCDTTSHESIVRLQPVLVGNRLLAASVAHLARSVAEQDEQAARAVVALANGRTDVVPGDLFSGVVADVPSIPAQRS